MSNNEDNTINSNKKPPMWIMKIAPGVPEQTEYFFKTLFVNPGCKNLIGYSKDEGKIEEFKKKWDDMKKGHLIVVMEEFDKVFGVVEVTSNKPLEDNSNGDETADWFYHRREAKLVKEFNPVFVSKERTSRTTIIKDASGNNAKAICDEVWSEIKNDYIHYINNKKIKTQEELEKLKKILYYKKQIILQGPPGTGKTRLANLLAEEIIKTEVKEENPNEDNKQDISGEKILDQKKLIQFHPSYTYEDFVRGITANTNANGQVEYKVENKTLAAFAQKALDNPESRYVLILDEINRANLPSVLGELIYALEYRYNPEKPNENIVESMYPLNGDRTLKLPENLFIIGTMNTADRSVGTIDYAIKRRFAFINIIPTKDAIDEVITDEGLKTKAIALYEEVEKLFNEKNEENKPVYLQSDFKANDVQLGHSYFLAKTLEELEMKLEYEIKPILLEYVKDGVLEQNAEKVIDDLKIN